MVYTECFLFIDFIPPVKTSYHLPLDQLGPLIYFKLEGTKVHNNHVYVNKNNIMFSISYYSKLGSNIRVHCWI